MYEIKLSISVVQDVPIPVVLLKFNIHAIHAM